LLKRKSTIINKQVNLFTTNIDVFLEKSLETASVEYNDGFRGRFNPVFNFSNFKKTYYKTSLHYDNVFELPVFNLLKVHGSLTWNRFGKEDITFSHNLELIRKINKLTIPDNQLIQISDSEDTKIEDLIESAKDKKPASPVEEFIKEYEKLAIVNPTKEKFRETVLNRNYYELLRIYSNELEKENTVLFVMGFSFRDEHIREVTLRVASSNPTLIIYIISYTSNIGEEILQVERETTHNNIKVFIPNQTDKNNGDQEDEFNFNFSEINDRIFLKVLGEIGKD